MNDLTAVRRALTWTPTDPLERARVYMPFDHVLAEEHGDEELKTVLGETTPRVRVEGWAGSGKSSRISYAFAAAGQDAVPVWVAGTHLEEVVTDAGAFLRNVGQAISQLAPDANVALRETATYIGSDHESTQGSKLHIGPKFLQADVGRDVRATIAGVQERGYGQLLDGVARAIQIVTMLRISHQSSCSTTQIDGSDR
ncbi:MAG: hypothetical protein WKF94_17915 [Solirubrobacteraceae bacterium]